MRATCNRSQKPVIRPSKQSHGGVKSDATVDFASRMNSIRPTIGHLACVQEGIANDDHPTPDSGGHGGRAPCRPVDRRHSPCRGQEAQDLAPVPRRHDRLGRLPRPDVPAVRRRQPISTQPLRCLSRLIGRKWSVRRTNTVPTSTRVRRYRRPELPPV